MTAGARLLRRLNTPLGGVLMLIVTTLLARLLFAASLGLGIDESYMVAAGRTFRLGYFDHPPISWWMAWGATWAAGSDAASWVRLPFVLLFSLSTWLMFRLASDLYGACAGLWSAVLLNAAPVLGVTAGAWVLPDGPLIAALLGAGLCFVRAVRGGHSRWGWWIGTGASLGLALCSKYTAVLTGAGFALFLLSEPGGRRWLTRPQPWAAALLALAMFGPVLGWNEAHGWASLVFQGGRADGGRWHPFGPIATLAGEALFLLPWVFIPLAICLVAAARRGTRDWRGWLMLCCAMPPLCVFEIVSLRGHVLFHWAAPGVMMALPLLGDAIGRLRRGSRWVRVALVSTACVVPLGALLAGTEVRFNWLPDVIEDFALGHDPDIAAVDWTSLRIELSRRGEMGTGVAVAATRWSDAGKIDYALRGAVPVICLGDDPREYGLSAPSAAFAGRDLLIISSRDTLATVTRRFGGAFDRIDEEAPVLLLHAGRPAMRLRLFRARHLHFT